MLLRGSAEFGPRGLDSAFLDLQDHGNIEQLDSPRILGSHLPFELLPRQVKDKKTKIVYVFRHLKSVLTSGYCQVKGTQMMAGSSNQMTMDMYADFFFTPPSKSQAVYLLLCRRQHYCRFSNITLSANTTLIIIIQIYIWKRNSL